VLPLVGTPPVVMPTNASYSFLRDPDQVRVIDEEVEALLRKGAIEKVVSSPGYYSRVFVVPKEDGGWRPILNLKRLNKTYFSFRRLSGWTRRRTSLRCFVRAMGQRP